MSTNCGDWIMLRIRQDLTSNLLLVLKADVNWKYLSCQQLTLAKESGRIISRII